MAQPFAVANTLTQRMSKGINSTVDEGQTPVVTHSLRGEGFDVSEDGTGRGKGDAAPCVATSMQVRRLTPTECERLQGFPDGHTAIPYRNKPACDGPRYKALGNSMAVPVMAWIGDRIAQVDAIAEAQKEGAA